MNKWYLPAAGQPLASLFFPFLFPWKASARSVGECEAGDLEWGAVHWPVLQAEIAVLTDSSEAWAQTAAAAGRMPGHSGWNYILYCFFVITELSWIGSGAREGKDWMAHTNSGNIPYSPVSPSGAPGGQIHKAHVAWIVKLPWPPQHHCMGKELFRCSMGTTESTCSSWIWGLTIGRSFLFNHLE